MRTRAALLLFAAVSSSQGLANAQVIRAGAEFRVNVSTTGDQLSPSVSVAGTGDVVVVWSSSVGDRILGRRYGVAGAPLTDEFLADATLIPKSTPAVATDARGNFVVAWDHFYGSSIRGRLFDGDAQPRSGELPFAFTFNSGDETRLPRLDGAANGWAVLTHVAHWPANPAFNGFGFKLLTRDGNTMCSLMVSSGADGGAAAAVRPNMSWIGVTAHSSLGVDVRHFPSACFPFPTPMTVTPPGPVSPAVDTDADGNAVLVWMSTADGDQTGIRGMRLDALSAPIGSQFDINSTITGAQTVPSVSVSSDGSFVVAWQSSTGDGSGDAVFARRFRADGTPRELDFVVNTYTTGDQAKPIVASDYNGNFVVAWESLGGHDGDGGGVFAQRFGGARAMALAVDAAGNGVLEAGETVTVAPSWRNVNGIAQTFIGAATSFSGPGTPGNPSYLLPDGAADYGTLANGSTASCTLTGNCFSVTVTQPSPRPSLHWDARLREEIAPAALGQSQVWSLHLGDSFADVARTNPFYRFVETLLHAGVTGGCSGSSYCPSSPTTRAEMAVFVLMAREGVGYGRPPNEPRACFNPPPFIDVPVSHPFCRWIKELVARGVVSGCGNGQYCPTDPVTREQMAVFVLRTLEGPSYVPPACTTEPFADMPVTSPFCSWVGELARRGVVAGCGGGNYCPASPVSREQMGVFLGVTFALTLYGL